MDDTTDSRTAAASPYATGGGGTVLEHRFGAVLLACLLTADPVVGLGDDVDPIEVVFQASSFSPVDDLVAAGRGHDGRLRRLSIAVRRTPSLVPSSSASIALIRTFVRVTVEHWEEVRQGSWRLQLATASPNRDVQQLRQLAEIARSAPDNASFRTAAARPSGTSRPVRDRLVQLDRLVAHAADAIGDAAEGITPSELTWRVLSALRTRELRLEGVDMSDRTECVTRLRSATTEGTAQAADDLFGRLAELSDQYAPAGAVVSEASLRRELGMHIGLARSPRHREARCALERLAERLRQRTGSRLSDGSVELELEREQPRDALVEAMSAVSPDGAALLVSGEPDVGKSALLIKASDSLASQASVTMLSLRDLPSTSLETEALLEVPLVELLAGEAVGPLRLLLVDGAESVLEGRGALLTDLAGAAMAAGLGIVAVTRSDAAVAVADALRQATRTTASFGGPAPVQHEVPRLSDAEIDKVARRFAALARLRGEPRARWLLGRPGLTDLLLRGDAAQALPDGALSEADVFAAVWSALVRRGERTFIGGPSPDSRERALLLLARALLLGGRRTAAAEPGALPTLRSDGLLLAAGPTSAWNPGDEFASDLIRDLCIARLLIVDGVELLLEAGGPRWALRAARLACQALIASAGADSERARTLLQEMFDALASQHGARWAALPLEAMLTLGSAHEVIARAWPALTDGDSQALIGLVRVALQRYVQHGIGDAVMLAPLVEVALEQGAVGAGRHGRHDELHELICELVLGWLRGLSLSGGSSNSLRARVRDRLLAEENAGDDFVVEALALLGPDLDDAAAGRLRRLAEEGGGDLGPAVESMVAGKTMAQHRPDLLLELTDAYYIDRPRSRSRGTSGYSMVDDGVRHHTGLAHLGATGAGWLFGPFWWLLNARPVESLRVVNELLDHAASVRIAHLQELSSYPGMRAAEGSERERGLTLELPTGPRWCVGDQHVWTWYRGSSVGPYPAMSALLAVEMFADRLVKLGIGPRRVTELLLHDCHNLAMPSLIVGFLVRHLDHLEDELDPWLARSEVWEREFARVTAEGHMHVQGPDPSELAGLARRRFSLRDAAMELVTKAILAGNAARLETLANVADALLAGSDNADNAGAPTEQELLTRAGWASCLLSDNYRLVEQADGTIILEFEPPADVLAGLASSNTSIARGQRAWHVLTQYGGRDDRSAVTDTLPDDLAFVAELVERPPERFGPPVAEVAAAVAATALVCHARRSVSLPPEKIAWAAAVLADVALRPTSDTYQVESATYVMGATRSAACGLPALLLDRSLAASLEAGRLAQALLACARSPFDEVRRMLAENLEPIWSARCDSAGSYCRHTIVLQLVKEMIRDCQLGDWDQTGQQRTIRPLTGDPADSLADVQTESLLINRLTAPIAAVMAAARSACCVSGEARRLQDQLLHAYRRGAIYWDEQGYGSHSGDEHRPVARAMFIAAATDDPGPLHQCLRDFAGHPALIEQLLHSILLICTYDAELRASLPMVWPGLMRTALDVNATSPMVSDRRGHRGAAALIPRPSLDLADRDPDRTLEVAQRDWVDLESVTDLVEEWIPLVRGDAHALDALLGLIETGASEWQATVGLAWVESLIGSDYVSVASRTYGLPTWLQRLRCAGTLDPVATARFHRVIDGLVAAGDQRVVALQRAEE